MRLRWAHFYEKASLADDLRLRARVSQGESYRIRGYLRSLKSIQWDLGQRPGTEELSRAARELHAFYDRLDRLADVLVASEPPPKTKPAYKRGKPKRRNRRLKPTSSDFTLGILREALEPLSASEIRERLAVDYKAIGRQGMSYTLRKLEREGKAERGEAEPGRARQLWRALD